MRLYIYSILIKVNSNENYHTISCYNIKEKEFAI